MAREKLPRVPVREQAPEVRAHNFDEVCLGYNEEEAVAEANRCLGCKKPMCVGGCPVNINIPAFIETFGALETTEKILSIPVNVMSPLSTFDNIKTMYEELSAEGVGNIKFKLTGFANGGMFSSIPYRLKWEKAVGGAKGYSDLVEYAD